MPDPTPQPDDVQTLRDELATTQAALAEAQQTITALERRQRIDALLAESDAVDIEVARLLTETAVATMDEPDLQRAVDDLRRDKPYLFRRQSAAGASAMPARSDDAPPPTQAAAQQALATGNRRDLLRYLRMKRQR